MWVCGYDNAQPSTYHTSGTTETERTVTRYALPGIPAAHRLAERVTESMILHELHAWKTRYGCWPNRHQYEQHEPHKYKSSFLYHKMGHRHFSALAGYYLVITGRGASRQHTYQNTNSRAVQKSREKMKQGEFDCFNHELCVYTPPKKVKGKQEYCSSCKHYRGWYD